MKINKLDYWDIRDTIDQLDKFIKFLSIVRTIVNEYWINLPIEINKDFDKKN